MTEYKGYNIVSDGTYGMKEIKPTTRGSVPGELRGVFTNETFARKSIDAFLISKGGKDVEASVVN